MKKRDSKRSEKEDESYSEELIHKAQINQFNKNMGKVQMKKKPTLIDLYQNYQSILNEEYILKLFYFTTLVQQY